MYDKLIDPIAQMWATHPEAATLALRWAAVEQQLEAEGDDASREFAGDIRERAAAIMKSNLGDETHV